MQPMTGAAGPRGRRPRPGSPAAAQARGLWRSAGRSAGRSVRARGSGGRRLVQRRANVRAQGRPAPPTQAGRSPCLAGTPIRPSAPRWDEYDVRATRADKVIRFQYLKRGPAAAGAAIRTTPVRASTQEATDYDCAGGSGDGPDYTGQAMRVVGDDHFDLEVATATVWAATEGSFQPIRPPRQPTRTVSEVGSTRRLPRCCCCWRQSQGGRPFTSIGDVAAPRRR